MSSHEKLKQMWAEGRITRREFLARCSALGITATLSPFFLNSSARAAVPQEGGVFKLGMAGGHTSNSLDPVTFNDVMMQMTSMGFLRNCLVEQDHNGRAIPELAESWEPSPDAKQWTFKLRKGVEFHNGKTMEADDVIFSIDYHRGEKSKSPIKALVKIIQEIKKIDKHTIRFNLKNGSADFPYVLASTRSPIFPTGTTDFNKGIGTGGYILESFEPGVRLLAKKNPNYWKEGRAHFDAVEVTVINDTIARTTALKTGQIHAMNRPDRKTAHLLKRQPGLQLIEVPGGLLYTFPMLVDVPPYTDNDVRLALKYSVDREQMLDTVLHGYGAIGNDHPVAPIVKFYAEDLPQRNYDPDKARFLMKKAGKLDHTFKLHTSNAAFDGAVDAATLWKEHAAKAGIDIQIVREPQDGYWNNVWMNKPWCACFWFSRATADWMFSVAYAEDAEWNDMHWKHERFNKLLNEARAVLDEQKRDEMYQEMQKIVRDEGGVVIPMVANMLDAASDKVRFENPAGNWELDGLRCCERWWFDS
ncbi:MAG: ABC transporter substrate-binding protein [Desulfohalobiaceae bacterium]|nr:ABC transporter substrate-binding protein [Desulfohalobiaceae bacterium]